MTENIKQLWKQDLGTDVDGVAISPDGEYIVCGTFDSYIHFFHRNGDYLWKYKLSEGFAYRISMSHNADNIAIGTPEKQHITLLDRNGNLVWEKKFGSATFPGAVISLDSSIVCGGSFDGIVHLWDIRGEFIWKFDPDKGRVWQISMTPDGEYIAVALERGIILLNQSGKLLWEYNNGCIGVHITPSGEYIAASQGKNVCLFDNAGQLLWSNEFDIEKKEFSLVSISADGQYISAGTHLGQSGKQTVFFLDNEGNSLWNFHANGVGFIFLELSSDSQFIAASSNQGDACLLNIKGEVLNKVNNAFGTAMTESGRYFAVSSHDHHIYLFENLLATGLDDKAASRNNLRQITINSVRNHYIKNTYLGLCQWFDKFDASIHNGQFEICEILLNEIRGQGYPLSFEEQSYVDSREGVLWLGRGIAHQKAEEYPEAEDCYLKSMNIQKNARCPACEGQVQMALDILEHEINTGETDPYLSEIEKELTVLGGAESMLCQRLNTASTEELRQVILTALRMRLVKPLLQVMQSNDIHTRRMAAAALGRFSRISESDTLLSSTHDPHWFVRWRAVDALGHQKEVNGPVMQTLCNVIEKETDPEVRRVLALSLGNLEDRNATPALAHTLDDFDADVQWTAVTALAKMGDRRALPKLRKVKDGKDFLERSVKEAAQNAIKEIKKRYPLAEVKGLNTCRLSEKDDLIQTTSEFHDNEPVLCISNIEEALPDTRIKITCMNSDNRIVFDQTSLYTELVNQTAPIISSLQIKEKENPDSTPLVEVIDGESQYYRSPSTSIEVGTRVRCIQDGASENSELRLGDTGTVRSIDNTSPLPVGVEWERNIGGHNGFASFNCTLGYGWFVKHSEIEPISVISDNTIIFKISSSLESGWQPGNYSVYINIFDDVNNAYEPAAEIAFKIV